MWWCLRLWFALMTGYDAKMDVCAELLGEEKQLWQNQKKEGSL